MNPTYEVREATNDGPRVGLYQTDGPDQPKTGHIFLLAGQRWCIIGGPFHQETSPNQLLIAAPVKSGRIED
jgi:hypothetical protein